MKSFPELFKKYRLRAEFNTFSAFSDALAEKGYFYDESIFSHWQKGTRVPTDRKIILAIIEIFVQRKAIISNEEADQFLAATGFGYLTHIEKEKLDIEIKNFSRSYPFRFSFLKSILPIIIILIIGVFLITTQIQKNYVNTPHTVPSAVTEPKKLVIGIDATLEPMEYIENGKNGRI